MSVTEIAALHDVNKSTVSRSVNRAKRFCRTIYSSACDGSGNEIHGTDKPAADE